MRSAFFDAIITNWVILAVGLAVSVTVIVGVGFSRLPAQTRWFLVGFMLALLIVGLALVVLVASGMFGRLLGAEAERYTAQAVCRRSKRRQGWQIVHGLHYQRHGDVDHVLAGPGGIYAIETKWASEPWTIDGGRLQTDRRWCPLEQARAGAAVVERQLRHHRDRFDVRVTPVLVIWGPGAPVLPGGRTVIGGVEVLEGRRHRRWGQVFDSQSIDPAIAKRTVAVLTALQKGQQAWETARRR